MYDLNSIMFRLNTPVISAKAEKIKFTFHYVFIIFLLKHNIREVSNHDSVNHH